MTSNSNHVISISYDLDKKFFLNFYEFTDNKENNDKNRDKKGEKNEKEKIVRKKIVFDESLNPYWKKSDNFEPEAFLELKVKYLRKVKCIGLDGRSLQLPLNIRGFANILFFGIFTESIQKNSCKNLKN